MTKPLELGAARRDCRQFLPQPGSAGRDGVEVDLRLAGGFLPRGRSIERVDVVGVVLAQGEDGLDVSFRESRSWHCDGGCCLRRDGDDRQAENEKRG